MKHKGTCIGQKAGRGGGRAGGALYRQDCRGIRTGETKCGRIGRQGGGLRVRGYLFGERNASFMVVYNAVQFPRPNLWERVREEGFR